MSFSFSKGAREVHWRASDGRQRSRRFGDDERATKRSMNDPRPEG
jgi:hypothetical protein